MLLILVDIPFFFFHNRGIEHEVKRGIQMTIEEKYGFAPLKIFYIFRQSVFGYPDVCS